MTQIVEYDPHLLYQAINITVELEYHVSMKLVYRILLTLSERRKPDEPEPSIDDLIKLVKAMYTAIDSEGIDIGEVNQDLKAKIKLILKMLNCEMSNEDLNKILRGQVSINDALTKEAQLAWKLIFDKDDNGRAKPVNESINWLFILAEDFTVGKILEQKNQNYLKHCEAEKRKQIDFEQHAARNARTIHIREKDRERNSVNYLKENETLDEKLRKLRLYLGHIQGYDRDLDGDGERGMDPVTGEIRDYGDIFLADKRYSGAIVQDLDHDGLDIEDIK